MDLGARIGDALRVFRRERGYAALVVGTLGLGIGANTAIFSLVNGVLLQPLPYAHGSELVRVRQGPLLDDGTPRDLSPLEVVDVRERSSALDRVVEYHTMFFNLIEPDQDPERVQVGVVSWDFFEALGVPPALGRTFTPAEDHIGAEPVLVLGHDYWLRRFGGDPNVVGRMVEMNNRAHRVVGVLPPVPTYPNQNDVWMPWYACPFRVGDGWHLERRARSLLTVGRLAPGATREQAHAELARIAGDLHAEFPEAYAGVDQIGASVVPLKEELTAEARPTFLVLMGLTGMLLLLACANVGNLALARMNRRQGDLAVRTALGASRARLIRQQIDESVALAVAGALLGVLMAYASVGLLSEWAAGLSPRFAEVGVDRWVLGFALVASLAVGLVVGSIPGLHLRRTAATLREDKGTGSLRRQRVRTGLVVLQVAMAFVLLTASGLMIRSFGELVEVDPGFESAGVLAVTVDLDWAQYTDPVEGTRFFHELLDRVEGRSGVLAATAATDYPMSGNTFQMQRGFLAEGQVDDGNLPRVNTRIVSDGYFETLGIEMLEGRGFRRDDDLTTEPVVVLSRAAARRLLSGGSAVGRRISLDGGQTWANVIGVAEDVRQAGFDGVANEEVYQPSRQMAGMTMLRRVLVRTRGDPASFARTVTEEVYALDADQPVSFVRTMDQVVAERLSSPKTLTTLLALFALVALVTAGSGILAVVAFTTAQRRREIGIRLALGGEPGGVLRMILGRGLLTAAAGLALGVGVAIPTSSLLRSFLFGIEPTDPTTLVTVAALLMAIAALATWVPARRGVRVNPVEAFRAEG